MMKRICCITLVLLLSAGGPFAKDISAQEGVARVNDAVISKMQLQSEMNRLMPRIFFHQGVDKEKLEQLRREALDDLIEKELKYQEAERLGLEVAKRELKRELKKVIASYPSRKAFNERLKAGNFTTDDVLHEIRRNKLIDLVYQKEVVDKVRVTEEEARAYYDKNKDKFVQPLQLHLRDVLLKVPPLADDFEKKTIRGKADAVARRIREGLSFDEAVRDYSEDQNKDRGGDMGLLHKGRLAPEIEKELLILKPGETAGPFEAFKGFYIFRLEEVRPERLSPFVEVKEKLIADLTDKAVEEREAAWLEGLKSKAEISVVESSDEKSLDSMER